MPRSSEGWSSQFPTPQQQMRDVERYRYDVEGLCGCLEAICTSTVMGLDEYLSYFNPREVLHGLLSTLLPSPAELRRLADNEDDDENPLNNPHAHDPKKGMSTEEKGTSSSRKMPPRDNTIINNNNNNDNNTRGSLASINNDAPSKSQPQSSSSSSLLSFSFSNISSFQKKDKRAKGGAPSSAAATLPSSLLFSGECVVLFLRCVANILEHVPNATAALPPPSDPSLSSFSSLSSSHQRKATSKSSERDEKGGWAAWNQEASSGSNSSILYYLASFLFWVFSKGSHIRGFRESNALVIAEEALRVMTFLAIEDGNSILVVASSRPTLKRNFVGGGGDGNAAGRSGGDGNTARARSYSVGVRGPTSEKNTDQLRENQGRFRSRSLFSSAKSSSAPGQRVHSSSTPYTFSKSRKDPLSQGAPSIFRDVLYEDGVVLRSLNILRWGGGAEPRIVKKLFETLACTCQKLALPLSKENVLLQQGDSVTVRDEDSSTSIDSEGETSGMRARSSSRPFPRGDDQRESTKHKADKKEGKGFFASLKKRLTKQSPPVSTSVKEKEESSRSKCDSSGETERKNPSEERQRNGLMEDEAEDGNANNTFNIDKRCGSLSRRANLIDPQYWDLLKVLEEAHRVVSEAASSVFVNTGTAIVPASHSLSLPREVEKENATATGSLSSFSGGSSAVLSQVEWDSVLDGAAVCFTAICLRAESRGECSLLEAISTKRPPRLHTQQMRKRSLAPYEEDEDEEEQRMTSLDSTPPLPTDAPLLQSLLHDLGVLATFDLFERFPLHDDNKGGFPVEEDKRKRNLSPRVPRFEDLKDDKKVLKILTIISSLAHTCPRTVRDAVIGDENIAALIRMGLLYDSYIMRRSEHGTNNSNNNTTKGGGHVGVPSDAILDLLNDPFGRESTGATAGRKGPPNTSNSNTNSNNGSLHGSEAEKKRIRDLITATALQILSRCLPTPILTPTVPADVVDEGQSAQRGQKSFSQYTRGSPLSGGSPPPSSSFARCVELFQSQFPRPDVPPSEVTLALPRVWELEDDRRNYTPCGITQSISMELAMLSGAKNTATGMRGAKDNKFTSISPRTRGPLSEENDGSSPSNVPNTLLLRGGGVVFVADGTRRNRKIVLDLVGLRHEHFVPPPAGDTSAKSDNFGLRISSSVTRREGDGLLLGITRGGIGTRRFARRSLLPCGFSAVAVGNRYSRCGGVAVVGLFEPVLTDNALRMLSTCRSAFAPSSPSDVDVVTVAKDFLSTDVLPLLQQYADALVCFLPPTSPNEHFTVCALQVLFQSLRWLLVTLEILMIRNEKVLEEAGFPLPYRHHNNNNGARRKNSDDKEFNATEDKKSLPENTSRGDWRFSSSSNAPPQLPHNLMRDEVSHLLMRVVPTLCNALATVIESCGGLRGLSELAAPTAAAASRKDKRKRDRDESVNGGVTGASGMGRSRSKERGEAHPQGDSTSSTPTGSSRSSSSSSDDSNCSFSNERSRSPSAGSSEWREARARSLSLPSKSSRNHAATASSTSSHAHSSFSLRRCALTYTIAILEDLMSIALVIDTQTLGADHGQQQQGGAKRTTSQKRIGEHILDVLQQALIRRGLTVEGVLSALAATTPESRRCVEQFADHHCDVQRSPADSNDLTQERGLGERLTFLVALYYSSSTQQHPTDTGTAAADRLDALASFLIKTSSSASSAVSSSFPSSSHIGVDISYEDMRGRGRGRDVSRRATVILNWIVGRANARSESYERLKKALSSFVSNASTLERRLCYSQTTTATGKKNKVVKCSTAHKSASKSGGVVHRQLGPSLPHTGSPHRIILEDSDADDSDGFDHDDEDHNVQSVFLMESLLAAVAAEAEEISMHEFALLDFASILLNFLNRGGPAASVASGINNDSSFNDDVSRWSLFRGVLCRNPTVARALVRLLLATLPFTGGEAYSSDQDRSEDRRPPLSSSSLRTATNGKSTKRIVSSETATASTTDAVAGAESYTTPLKDHNGKRIEKKEFFAASEATTNRRYVFVESVSAFDEVRCRSVKSALMALADISPTLSLCGGTHEGPDGNSDAEKRSIMSSNEYNSESDLSTCSYSEDSNTTDTSNNQSHTDSDDKEGGEGSSRQTRGINKRASTESKANSKPPPRCVRTHMMATIGDVEAYMTGRKGDPSDLLVEGVRGRVRALIETAHGIRSAAAAATGASADPIPDRSEKRSNDRDSQKANKHSERRQEQAEVEPEKASQRKKHKTSNTKHDKDGTSQRSRVRSASNNRPSSKSVAQRRKCCPCCSCNAKEVTHTLNNGTLSSGTCTRTPVCKLRTSRLTESSLGDHHRQERKCQGGEGGRRGGRKGRNSMGAGIGGRLSLYYEGVGRCSYQETLFGVLYRKAFGRRIFSLIDSFENAITAPRHHRSRSGCAEATAKMASENQEAVQATSGKRRVGGVPLRDRTLYLHYFPDEGAPRRADRQPSSNSCRNLSFSSVATDQTGRRRKVCACGDHTHDEMVSAEWSQRSYAHQLKPSAMERCPEIILLQFIHKLTKSAEGSRASLPAANVGTAFRSQKEAVTPLVPPADFLSTFLAETVVKACYASALRVALLDPQYAIPRWAYFILTKCSFLMESNTRRRLAAFLAFGARKSLWEFIYDERLATRLKLGDSVRLYPTEWVRIPALNLGGAGGQLLAAANSISTAATGGAGPARTQSTRHIVDRRYLLRDALSVLAGTAEMRFPITVSYARENGTGTGPTIAFYSQVAKALCLRGLQMWREEEIGSGAPSVNNGVGIDEYVRIGKEGLFPSIPPVLATPITTNATPATAVGCAATSCSASCCNAFFRAEDEALFYIAGVAMARAFMDSRVFPLEISEVLIDFLRCGAPSLDHPRTSCTTQKEKGGGGRGGVGGEPARANMVSKEAKGSLTFVAVDSGTPSNTPPSETTPYTARTLTPERRTFSRFHASPSTPMSPTRAELFHTLELSTPGRGHSHVACVEEHPQIGSIPVCRLVGPSPTAPQWRHAIFGNSAREAEDEDELSSTQTERRGQGIIRALGRIDSQLCRSVCQLRDATYLRFLNAKNVRERADAELSLEALEVPFTLPGREDILLCPEGGTRIVDVDSFPEYVQKLAITIAYGAVAERVDSFLRGFADVVPTAALRVLESHEVAEMVCGADTAKRPLWSSEASFRSLLQPEHGYTSDSRVITWLVSVIVSDFTAEQQRQFLEFCTGCPRVPVGGFARMGKIKVVQKEAASLSSRSFHSNANNKNMPKDGLSSGANHNRNPADITLVSVNTCFLYLKVPSYSTREVLREKLLESIYGSEGFDLS